ncbi:MAG: hypothetical protein ABFD83_07495 [Armatimonadota bacterium]
MTKLKKVVKIILAVILVMFVVSIALGLYWGKKVESQMAAIKAAGAPITLADLAGPAIPDDKNAAVIYDKLFKLMSDPSVIRDRDVMFKVLSKSGEVDQKTWEEARVALSHNGKVFSLLDEALMRPECRFSSSIASLEVLQEQCERFAGLRDATRMLCAKALINAHYGQTDGVASSLEDAMAVRNAASGENTMLIGFLVKTAIVDITLANMRQALCYGGFSEAQLRHMSDALARIDINKDYRYALEGERVCFLQQTSKLHRFNAIVPFGYYDTSAYLDFAARQLSDIDISYSAARSRGTLKPGTERDLPLCATLTRQVAPVFQNSNIIRYKTQAEINLGRTALALESYKIKFGSYPKSLDDVESSMDERLPVDPFSGKSLIYKLESRGFVLYSLGPDQKDNNGAMLKSIENDTSRGDVLWGVAK